MAGELQYDSLPALWHEYDLMPRELRCRAVNRPELNVWQARLRAKVTELLGGFPDRKVPLDPILLEQSEEPEYRLEKIAFQADAGVRVPCYVLTPRRSAPPHRAVIALHGHGSGGVQHLLGRPLAEATRAAEMAHIEAHNYDYAHQLARHGFMVFAPEQRGFGERMETAPGMVFGDGLWRSSCRALAFNAMLLGKTLLGLRVWDVMRTLDYIATRREVYQERIGCVGLSGGGTTTLYAAALEPRISAAVVSGAFGSFRSSIMSTIHCDCNYIPGILQVAEMEDLAALIAPRPLLIENGAEDPIFPAAATEAAAEQVARVYALAGVPERFDLDIFPGGHRFSGNRAFTWFERRLSPSA